MKLLVFLEENGFKTSKDITSALTYSGDVKHIAEANVPFYILCRGEDKWSKSIMFGDNCSSNMPHKIFFIRTSKELIDRGEPSCFMYWPSNDFNKTCNKCHEGTAVKLETYEEIIDEINEYLGIV